MVLGPRCAPVTCDGGDGRCVLVAVRGEAALERQPRSACLRALGVGRAPSLQERTQLP
jgi:hypothetical protein